MTYPTKPDPAHAYAGDVSGASVAAVAAPFLSTDFANLKASTDAIIEFQKLAQRSDGNLQNGIVTAESLSSGLAKTLGVTNTSAVIDARSYGVSTTSSDNTAAFLSAYTAAVAQGKALYIPSGIYTFSQAVTLPVASNVTITGDGSANTYLIYTGANTTNDCFSFGAAGSNIVNWNISGLTFRSNTSMTAGIGVRFYRLCRSVLDDVTIDGQDGNKLFWHGIRFDGVDQVTWQNTEGQSKQDVVQVNGLVGALPKADLQIDGYKFSGGTVGIRVGGAFGGLYLGAGGVIGNSSHGLVIDTTLVAEANREILGSSLCAIDSNGGDGVRIDQSLSAQCFIDLRGWIATNTGHGINVINYNGAKMAVRGYIYNNTNDGLRISDASSFIHCDAVFNSNLGYSINPTVAATLLTLGVNRFMGSGLGDINLANVTPRTTTTDHTVTRTLNVGAVTTIDVGNTVSTGDLIVKNVGSNGAVLKLIDASGTPNKYMRAVSGVFQLLNSAFTVALVAVTDAGAATFAGSVTAGTSIKTSTTTVGGLVAAATAGAGTRHWVTDANATHTAGIGAVVVGGGVNSVPVVSDGTNWRIG